MFGNDSHERREHPFELLDVVALRHLGDLVVQLVQLILVDSHATRWYHVRAGKRWGFDSFLSHRLDS